MIWEYRTGVSELKFPIVIIYKVAAVIENIQPNQSGVILWWNFALVLACH